MSILLKTLRISRLSLVVVVLTQPFAGAQTPVILAPVGCGNVSGHYEITTAFDAPPTWNGVTPVGGDMSYNPLQAGWDPVGGVGYIDLGADWANWRITQTWTKYIQGRPGNGFPYVTRWWDDENDAVQDVNAVAESQINFNSQVHTGSGAWYKDWDAGAGSPKIPSGRYLMVKLPNPLAANCSDSNEYLFIGYKVTPFAATILTPFSSGPVVAGTIEGAVRMFDRQPSWNGSAPTGPISTGGNEFINAGWDGDKTAYIDFGAGWRTLRIQQCWTQYRSGQADAPTPYASLWWDSAMTNAPGTGSVMETAIKFGSQTHTTSGAWVRDVTLPTAFTPPKRYLMLKNNWGPSDDENEYAFIGYRDYTGTNYPPEVSIVGGAQSIQWTAHLVGQASDDGIPNPPSALTYSWTMVSGPSGGTVSFTAPSSLVTDATFSKVGAYVLRLTANDNGTTGLSSSATVNVTAAQASAPLTMPEVKAFNYSTLTLVDEVLCDGVNDMAGSAHPVIESSTGASQVQTILGRSCRVLLSPAGAPPGYFAYRLGVGKNLQAGKAYILVIEYPEDKPREVIVLNRGCETTRTFHTGMTLGDAYTNPYVPTNASSMHFGLSQQYRTMEQLFHLHNNFPALKQPRDTEYPRSDNPGTGFLAMIAQYSHDNIPLSAGAAASRVALYAAPTDWNAYAQQVTLPPNNLPKRHLFWREEMSDGELGERGGVSNDIDWFEWKAQLAKFLGMNTFTKDLLEFGYNQGFSSSLYTSSVTGEPMFAEPPFSARWEQIVYRLTGGSTAAPNGYGLDFMPYFEYAGSNNGYFNNQDLGTKKLSKPLIGLNNGNDYTGVYWAETMNVDCTDSASTLNPYLEGQALLNCTMTSLSGTTGGRPLFNTPDGNNRLDNGGAGTWGYIDFGANYANYRITQTWTRACNVDGPASPYPQRYWNNSMAGFTGSNPTPPAGSTAETNIQFITKPLNGRTTLWTRDMNVPVATPVIPPARYLMMRAATPLSQPNQFLFVGWINGSGSTTIKSLPIAGSGATEPSVWPRHEVQVMFNNPPVFNTNVASFAGAWFRPRTSGIPISFSDAALSRFATQANGGVSVTRAQLGSNQTLMDSYTSWWQAQRRAMLNTWAGYLRTNINPNAVLLYTWDCTEEGRHPVNVNPVITDDPSVWTGLASTTDYLSTLSNHVHVNSMLTKLGIYPSGSGQEEHCYSMPWPDPANYTSNNTGVMLTHTFNKLYTVSDSTSWQTFSTANGTAAIRHYCLNEDAMCTQTGTNWNTSPNTSPVGYFVSDADPAGPYVMISEARALAFGDPYNIGYLSSNSFNRCSPGYARDFNANFLALPAMTSTVVTGAANDSEVIVRRINTPSNGTWLAIVNVGLTEKLNVQITPPVTGTVTDAVTGATIPLTSGKIVQSFWPGRLKAVRIQ
jgi:hypothetical protein